MKKLISCCLILVNVAIASAQLVGRVGTSTDIREYLNPAQLNGLEVKITKSSQIIDGTPYLFPYWEGRFEVYSKSNKKYVFDNLNYDIKSLKIESKVGLDSVFQFDSDKIDFIKHNTEKYKFYAISGENQLCQVIYMSDKTIFLKGYNIVLIKEVINAMTDAVTFNARYEKKERYFCKINGKEFVEFDLKKKQILKLLGDKAKQVGEYAANSKVGFVSEKEVAQILQFYDTL